MESSRRIIILLVVGVVMVFGVIALRSFKGNESVVEVEKPVQVLVATRDVPQGSVVQPGADLVWAPIEPDKIEESFLRDDQVQIESFAGSISRRQLRVGEPITLGTLTRAGEGGFMSAVLEPGMRAVSISVSPTTGNAGFISPGDRVDLIVTHRIHTDTSTNKLSGTVVSETFVRNVRVLAVDQLLDNPENQAILAKTVTVEVTPRQAEQVSVAGDLGKISVMLRSLTSAESAEGAPAKNGRSYTKDGDVSGAMGAGGLASTIRVIRGDRVENVAVY